MTTTLGKIVRQGTVWALLGGWITGCDVEEVTPVDRDGLERVVPDCEVSDSTCDAGCTRIVDLGGDGDVCSCRSACNTPGCGVFGSSFDVRLPVCPPDQGLVPEPGLDSCSECVGSSS